MAIGVFFLVNTSMLTAEQKQHRVQWAKMHQANDRNRSIFTDESSFQLFENTIRQGLHMGSNKYQRRCWLSYIQDKSQWYLFCRYC